MKTAFKKTFEVIPGYLTVQAERIWGWDVFEDHKLIPIGHVANSYMGWRIWDDPLFLPKFYAAFLCMTGPSDTSYDPLRGAYNFRFKLEVQKNKLRSAYYYHIYHDCSYSEFSVFHVVPENDPREENHFVMPNDALFSNHDICRFTLYFCNYALGYMQGYGYVPEPFVKHSDYHLLLFGYSKGSYFSKHHEDPDQYEKVKIRLKKVAKQESIHP